MTDREQLIELMRKGYETVPVGGFVYEGIADYLLDHDVIVPPCKVGDTVYVIESNKIISCTVFSINYNAWGIPTSLYLKYSEFNSYAFISMKSIEKTVFLSHKDAEKALKKAGG